MSYPLVMLVGKAGCGKSTVASFLEKNHRAVSIAQADPIKRLAKILFGFSDEQLWGPSSMRNAPHLNFDFSSLRPILRNNELPSEAYAWLEEVTEGIEYKGNIPLKRRLRQWANDVAAEVISRKVLTPRYVLQSLGVDFGRKRVSEDIWSQGAIKTAQTLLRGNCTYSRSHGVIRQQQRNPPQMVVISDGRFVSEVLGVLEKNGHVWRIDSQEDLSKEAQAAGIAGHSSETEQNSIPDSFFTGFLVNDKTQGLRALEEDVAFMARKFLGAK